MKQAVLIILFVASICDGATKRFTHGSKKSFVKSTYGGFDLPRDEIVTRTTFKRHVEANSRCTGLYCVDGKWKCRQGGYNGDCYNVEHIIDRNGPEFKSYPECKDVPGNMIMSHGQWNQELGSVAQRYYYASVQEKMRVYGEDIIENARRSIQSCISKRYGKRFVEEDIPINTTEFQTYDVGIDFY